MEFSSLPEFDKQFKTLLRKYRTLEKDLDLLKTVLEKYPRGYPPRIVRVSRLGINTEIYKVKHFRCKSLKHKGSRSGIRIVYAFFAEEEKIEFVEIYYKEKDNIECDKNRILRYYS
jgi:mRNA-degrading endonuclease RelE of RelBE toxin-antitoxin system